MLDYIKSQRIDTIEKDFNQNFNLNLIKNHLFLSLDDNSQDDYIYELYKASVEYIEGYCRQDLVKTKKKLTINNFSGTYLEVNETLNESFTGQTLTIDTEETSAYTLYNNNTYFQIKFDNNIQNKDIEFTFYSGFETIPADLKIAILISIKTLFDDTRSEYSLNNLQNNRAIERITNKYKILY